jgi:hypothetical protein
MRMLRLASALILFTCATASAFGQECPQSNPNGEDIRSQVRQLEGRLVYHDSIRKWFELKLDQPQCNETSIELVPGGIQLQVLRGCRVRSTGGTGFSPTGYYSLATFQDVEKVEPVGACKLQEPLSDYSHLKPDSAIQQYRVDMHLDYEPGDHPIAFRVTSADKELQPWQAYASYYLTGDVVLYGHCGTGFVTEKVFGAHRANPSHFNEPRDPLDMAIFYLEGASMSGIKNLHLGYTCVRQK